MLIISEKYVEINRANISIIAFTLQKRYNWKLIDLQ